MYAVQQPHPAPCQSSSQLTCTAAACLAHSPALPAGVLDRREEHVLRDFVDAESRNYSGERFNRFVAELHSRIKSLTQRCGGDGVGVQLFGVPRGLHVKCM